MKTFMNYLIREMNKDDLQIIYKVLISSDVMTSYHHISEETLLRQFVWAKDEEHCSNMHDHYVIEIDDCVVGYGVIHWIETFLYDKPEGYISELFIHERFRGNRLWTALLNYMVDKAREKGCCRVWLLNSIGSESNSRKYYEKQGWQHDERDIRYVRYLS